MEDGMSERNIERELNDCSDALDKKCQEADSLARELAEARAMVSDAEEQNIYELRAEIDRLSRERDEAVTRADHAESEYRDLVKEYNDASAERDEARAELKETCDDLQRLNDDAVRYCRERDGARRALHEIVTNGEWISAEWCVSKAVYDLAYEADLRASTGEG
jgi:chromosome segregation ATPase